MFVTIVPFYGQYLIVFTSKLSQTNTIRCSGRFEAHFKNDLTRTEATVWNHQEIYHQSSFVLTHIFLFKEMFFESISHWNTMNKYLLWFILSGNIFVKMPLTFTYLIIGHNRFQFRGLKSRHIITKISRRIIRVVAIGLGKVCKTICQEYV